MKRQTWWRLFTPLVMAGVLAAGTALAADSRPNYGPGMMGGYGMGPGMMGGYGMGPGMMYEEGGAPGWGYGPGMMGGYGMGPGMMGGYGMGPGMMGGYGMGPGMMGGYGMGPGMMGGYGMGQGMMGGMGMMGPIWSLDLNDNQRRAVENIMNEQHTQHWAMMTSQFGNYGKLRELYSAEMPDAAAIGKVYDEIFRNQRAMIESGIKTRNRIYDQLSKEQKEQLKRWRWSERWGR